MPACRPSPLGAVLRGALAGAAGTLAMDVYGYLRHRAGGGSAAPLAWEFGGEPDWEKVPAPAQVGRRVVEGLTQRPLPAERAPLTNSIVHWSYGVGWGAAFGLVAGSLRRTSIGAGPLLGSVVWLSGYALLPLVGLYKPIWEYDARSLALDLSGHLAYGTATAAAFGALR